MTTRTTSPPLSEYPLLRTSEGRGSLLANGPSDRGGVVDLPPTGSFWSLLLSHRPLEVWAALLGGVLYVFQKSDRPSISARAIEAGVSGLIGYSWGEGVSAWAGVPPEVAFFLITAVGYTLLDGARSLVADREVFKSAILRILGGNNSAK